MKDMIVCTLAERLLSGGSVAMRDVCREFGIGNNQACVIVERAHERFTTLVMRRWPRVSS